MQEFEHHWTGRYNIGDVYSSYIVSHLYDTDLLKTVNTFIPIRFIGSAFYSWINDYCLFCGVGVHSENNKLNLTNTKNLLNRILLLRGKKTIAKVRKDGINISEDLPTGDPGILASLLFTKETPKKYDIGIVCHYVDEPVAKQRVQYLQAKYPDKKICIHSMGNRSMGIDNMFSFIKSCDRVIASSLHAMIFCHSFEIPVLFYSLLDGFKFEDYFSNYPNISCDFSSKETFEAACEKITDTNYVNSVNPTQKQVTSMQDRILSVLPYTTCLNALGKQIFHNHKISI